MNGNLSEEAKLADSIDLLSTQNLRPEVNAFIPKIPAPIQTYAVNPIPTSSNSNNTDMYNVPSYQSAQNPN